MSSSILRAGYIPLLAFALLASLVALGLSGARQATGQEVTQMKDKEVDELIKSLKPATPSNTDSEMCKLLKDRYNVAVEQCRRLAPRFQEGRLSLADLQKSVDLLTKAGLELWPHEHEARIELLERKVKFTQMAEEISKTRMRNGTGSPEGLNEAKYDRLTAEIQLLREKQSGGAASKP